MNPKEQTACQEKLLKNRQLLWIPSIHTTDVPHGQIPQQVPKLEEYWQKAKLFVAPALTSKKTVRLYPEGEYSNSGERVDFGQDHPNWLKLVQKVKARIVPGVTDYWDIALPFLLRTEKTFWEVCENKEAYLKTKAIKHRLWDLEAVDESLSKKYGREHQEEFFQLQSLREQTIVNRIHESLMPGEIGILFFGICHPMVKRLRHILQIQSFISEEERVRILWDRFSS